SDPFYEFRRTYEGPGGGSWTPVYRSKQVKDNLNPKWEPATVDVNALCGGDLDRRLQVAIYDFESSGKHQSMGSFETTGESPYAPSAPLPMPVPVSDLANMSLGGAMPMPVPPPQQRPTFVDYVSGNCDLNMCVAIDFTGSNGDPRKPGTLHHFSRDGHMNGYEKAISAVGSILSKYDTDQQYPVWGFGAKYDGSVRHCFQVGSEREVHGVKGILQAYKGTFSTPLIMSGPTVFTEVIELAAAQAKSRQQIRPLSYTILLLLTDGAVSDVEATKRSLVSVADAPLSIVIVGIGNADFTAMQFLDDFEKRTGANRDIVQFVQFNKYEYDKTALTRATLDEIPEQLVQFFTSRGIMPQPDMNF
ncbi:predicted protein, partial [Thalassiosira pseudonana CCMP1335]